MFLSAALSNNRKPFSLLLANGLNLAHNFKEYSPFGKTVKY